MKNVMTYRGYSARVEYSSEDAAFVGHVAGIDATVGFHGESITELMQGFHDAVDTYLLAAEKAGRPPQKPYSGQMMLRVPPEVHARSALAAELAGKSLNQWAAELFDRVA